MRRLFQIAVLTAITVTLLALPTFISKAGSTTPVAVIVQLRDDPAAVYQARAENSGGSVSADQLQAYRSQLSAKQDQFLNALSANGITAAVVTRNIKGFDGNVAATIALRYTLVLNGMALTVSPSSIAALRAMPQVKSVSPDEVLTTSLNQSVKYIRAQDAYGDGDEQQISSKGYVANVNDNVGQDVIVSIIDTGIDWTHPMFGGDANPPRLAVQPTGINGGGTGSDNFNKKVIYYLPLTDLAVEDGFGHGTHVASTVAGFWQQTLTGEQVHGVAPQAKLMSYKVCSDTFSSIYSLGGPPLGGCESSNTIMALEDSVSPTTLPTIHGPNGDLANPLPGLFPKPVAKVINMSLGGSGGPDNPTAVAASNAALAGAVVVAASGNSGPGEGTTGSPAAGTHVISVGATTHPGNAGNAFSVDVVGGPGGMHANVMTGSATPPNTLTNKYVYCGFADTPDQVPDSVNGRIALAARGSTVDGDAAGTGVFANKAAQAAAKGAIALVVYNNVDGELEAVTVYGSTIPVFGISKANGETLKGLIGSSLPGAVSANQITVHKATAAFMGEMAGFSSRGPVRGLGQIKPDISAPGVQVLAACPPASLLGALAAAASPTTPNYIRIDGTSMATPHTSGAVALIKQAHHSWKPDVVRTALINTATNMRSTGGGSKTDGLTADSIISQGGGLIDVAHAIKARALMGVTGDGVDKPGILGSYSYGEVPVANSRITYTAPINVTVRDISGEGGTYNLNVANNRDLQLAGISVSLSPSSVSLPAGGSTTFTVNATFDGDQIRDVMAGKVDGNQVTFESIQMQWFVTATRSDNKESLRMPFYFKPGPSLPAQPNVQTSTQTATVTLGDQGSQAAEGQTYVDVPFEVSGSTYKIEALSEWFERPTGSQEDIDYQLLDPDGAVIASSGGPAGASEYVSVRVSRAGTYKHRLVGYQNVATDVTITTTLSKGPEAPAAQAFAGDMADQGQQVDFDGSVVLHWTPAGGETGYEIEHSTTDAPDWETIGTAPADATSFAANNLPNGTHSFRIRGIHPGQIGKYVTNAGNAASVVVDHRTLMDVTSQVSWPIANQSLSGGVSQWDVALVNNATQNYLPYVELNIVSFVSSSGLIRAINADNSKNGTSAANAALFSYTAKLGTDGILTPTEISQPRTMRFQNPRSEGFYFDAIVTAYVPTGGAGGGAGGGSSQQMSSGGGSTSGGLDLTKITTVRRFTYNPLTNKVTSQLVNLKL